MKNIRYALWGIVAVAFIVFIAISLPRKDGQNESPITPLAGFNQGAHFTLIDHNGSVFNSGDEINEGEYGLIFFGFTHCPVICPTELQKFAVIMDELRPETASKIHPLFITIDPERDTVDAMQSYVPMFHEDILGLTGNTANIHRVLDDWKVFYSKVNDPQFTEYTMDHSTYAYFVNSDMKILGLFKMQNTPDQIVDYIEKMVR